MSIPNCTCCGSDRVTFEGRSYDVPMLEASLVFRCAVCGTCMGRTEEPTDRHAQLDHCAGFASTALLHDGFEPLTSNQIRALWWGPLDDARGMLEDFIDRVLNSDDAKMAVEHAGSLLLEARSGEA